MERTSVPLPSGDRLATMRADDGTHSVLVAAGDGGASYRAARTGTIAVPRGAGLRRVYAIGDTGGGTIRVQGGDAIPVPQGAVFDVDFGGGFVGLNDRDVIATGTTTLLVTYDAA